MRLIKQSLLILVLIMFCVSCATFTSTTYKTLYIAGTSYDLAMKTVARLQAQGLITTEQRAEIDKLANIYYVSYHASVDAFEIYQKAQTTESKNVLMTALASASTTWAKMAEYVNRISPNAIRPILEEVK